MPLDYILERALKDELARRKDYVASDAIREFSEYRYQVGQICGIQMAINLLIEARERVGLEGDLDE